MTRIGKVLVAAMLVLPAAAQAQRPGATMQTRSAELYLTQAAKENHPDEQAKLFKKALDMATQGTTANPANAKTWFTLGEVYAAMGDAVGADSAFTKAETMYPDYAKDTDTERLRAYVAAFNAGITAIQKNDVQGAVKNLEAAAKVYHKKPAATLNLGNLYAKLNDNEKAADAYRRALDILRGPERKTLPPAEEKQWGQWEQAAAFNLAQILAMSDKNEEAVKAYQDYLARDPNNVMAQSNLAIVYNRMGKKDEAQKIYTTLLNQDLSDEDYFAVGVGLFRGDQYAAAAQAFQKAITKNPSFRDSYYNLAQAIYSQISDLEDKMAKAKLADQKAMQAQLKPMYEQLIDIADKARSFDPNNRNVLALLARGYRGMADVVPVAQAAAWKEKTLGVMKIHQDLPYEVTEVAIVNNNGEYKVTGNVVNLKGTEGQPVKLTISYLGKDGTVLGTQDVTVTTPKTEDQVPFSTTFKTDKAVGGWKYEIVK